MKKVQLILILFFLSGFVLFAQNGSDHPKSLSGSTIESSDEYIPGATMDLMFQMSLNSSNYELPDSVAITFPAGFTVNNASNPLPGSSLVLNSISGNTVSWGANSNNGSSYPVINMPVSGYNSFTAGQGTYFCSHNGCNIGQYSDYADGYTVIYTNASSIIHIKGNYNTEGCCDFIRIYDGEGLSGNILWQSSGQGNIDYSGQPGQTLTVRFSSDLSVTYTGFSFFVTNEEFYRDFYVNVTVEGNASGDKIIPWHISGNMQSGTDHDIFGTITLKRAPMDIQLSTTFPDCGSNNGSVAAEVISGAVEPVSFLWNDPLNSTTNSITNLAPGFYSVTVTDATGFTGIANVVMSNMNGPVINTAIVKNPCYNSTDGSAYVSVTSGIPTYTYLWSDNTADSVLTNAGAGIFSVTVTDGDNCKTLATVELTQPENPVTANIFKTDLPCANSTSGGSVWVEVSGGTPGYSFDWDNGAFNGDNWYQPGAGLHTVVVTDASSCQTTESITVGSPSAIEVAFTNMNPKCNGGNDGNSIAQISGGTPGYNFSWSTGATISAISNLSSGTYYFYVTDTNNCYQEFTSIITDPDPLSFIPNVTNPSCGNSDGAIMLYAQGGTFPHTYQWQNFPGITGNYNSNLSFGTYQITVTDANLCSFVDQVVLSSSTAPEITILKEEPLCSGYLTGKAWVTVVNPVGTYTYNWSNNTAEDTIKNVAAGDYYVTVTDENMCSTVQLVKISEPPALNVEIYKNDISCNNGTNDGSMWVSVSGGTPYYTYLWSNNETGSEIYSLGEGTYSVTVSDNLGCQVVKTENIILPEVLSVSYDVTHPTCFDEPTGAIDVTVTGGTPPYYYYWSGPRYSSSQDLIDVFAGEYYLEVGDDNGCSEYLTIQVNNPIPIGFEVAQTNYPTCGNTSDGEVFVTATGGSGNYTYYWENTENPSINGATADLIDIPSGEYTYKITDDLGCIYSNYIYIEGVPNIYLSFTTNPAACEQANGMASVIPSNGTEPYNFVWSNNVEDDTIDMVTTGVYVVTVTDAIGCQMIDSVAVSNPSDYYLFDNITNVSCNGGSDGSINVTANLSKQGLTYTWSNGGTTETITNLQAGTYVLTFTDDLNCIQIRSYTVTQPSPIEYSIYSENIGCPGEENGVIEIQNIWGGTPSGGQGTNKGSSWNNEGNNAPKPPFQYFVIWDDDYTGTSRYGLSAGTYSFTIYDDNDCEKTGSVTLTEPAAIIYQNSVVTNVSCYNAYDGSITINASGGDGPLSYSLNNEMWGESNVFENLSPGFYDVYVGTGNFIQGGDMPKESASMFCSQFFETVEILGPQNELQASGIPTNASCFGESTGYVTFYASGGTPPYLYSVDGGLTFSNNNVVNGLSAGNYTLVIKDANECTQSIGNVTILQPQDITISFMPNSTIYCFGESTASISAWATGGTGMIEYLWSDNTTDYSIYNIGAGTYDLTVTDANGCTKTDSYIVTQPEPIVITPVVTDVLCNGQDNGTITLNATGGSPGYMYSADGQNYSSSNLFVDLSPSTYTLFVRDTNNCVQSYSDIIISEPAVLTATIQTTDVLCYGASTGTASAMPAGGTYPYTYAWAPAASDSALANLPANTYSLTVTDINGCEAFATTTITQPATELLIDSVKTTDISCLNAGDGVVTIYTSGGTGSIELSIDAGLNWSAGQFMGLVAGTYSPAAKDANGCIVTSSDVVISEPTVLSVSATTGNISCYQADDGVINASATGGTIPYVYDIGTAPQESGLFENLPAASYSLTVTDANGCQAQELLVITEPAELTATIQTTDVLCYGASTGTASAMPAGGTYPYTYAWAPAASDSALANLPANTYSLTVSDVNGCDAFATTTITQPATELLIDSILVSNALCNGDANGSATVYTSGGTGTITYQISQTLVNSTGVFTGLSADIYTPQVTDANGCVVAGEAFAITEPQVLSLTLSITNAICFGGSNGAIAATATGGTPPYTFNIGQGAQSGNTFINLPAGIYSVTVTDANACQAVQTAEVLQPAELTASISVTNVSCYGLCDGTASIAVQGGVSPYTYSWFDLSIQSSLSGICAGTAYTATVTDVNGCIYPLSFNITQPDTLVLSVSATTSACNICDGTATVTITGGTPIYTHIWSDNQTTGTASNLCGGNLMTVTVTDANDCSASIDIEIPGLANSTLSGTVIYSGGVFPDNAASAELYKITNITQAELMYTQPVSAAAFSFPSVEFGEYLLKINVTDNSSIPLVMSTYLDSTVSWEQSQTVNVDCDNTYNFDIHMFEVTIPAGTPTGSLSGYITLGDFGGKGSFAMQGEKLVGEPVPGAEIYVELEPDDEPIINTTSNDTGYYEVSGLPEGNTYSMKVDIPGLPLMSTYQNITIGGGNTTYTNLNFYVDTSATDGAIFINSNISVAVNEKREFSFTIYPNPFIEFITVDYSLPEEANVKLELYDINGKAVAELMNGKQAAGSHEMKYETKQFGLANGAYLLRLQINNNVYLKKITCIR